MVSVKSFIEIMDNHEAHEKHEVQPRIHNSKRETRNSIYKNELCLKNGIKDFYYENLRELRDLRGKNN